MTSTGFNWLTSLIEKQGDWFDQALKGWIEYITGSNDHSADFCNPFYYPLAALMGVARFFCAALTTLFFWPIAALKDLQHFSYDAKAAISSLLCVTPIYVIFMTIFKLLASVLCIVAFVLLLVFIIFVLLFLGFKYAAGKIANGIGTVVGGCIRAATREN